MSARDRTPFTAHWLHTGVQPSHNSDNPIRIEWAPALTARVVRRTQLRYREGADPALDRPAHVRSGSGLTLVPFGGPQRALIVQDDANFLACIALDSLDVTAITLPAGFEGKRQFDAGRHNKKHKLDIESCLVLSNSATSYFCGFGSGSAVGRDNVVLAELDQNARETACIKHLQVVSASALYAQFRADSRFCGSELNIEGAAYLVGANAAMPPRVRFFQRGNGAAVNGVAATDATVDVEAGALLGYLLGTRPEPPPLLDVRRYELPAFDAKLTFTDATPFTRSVTGSLIGELGPAHGPSALLFLAAAEASANSIDDGPVSGVGIGLMLANGQAVIAPIVDENGRKLLLKVEGLMQSPSDPLRVLVVVDRDNPDAPTEWLELALEGPWV